MDYPEHRMCLQLGTERAEVAERRWGPPWAKVMAAMGSASDAVTEKARELEMEMPRGTAPVKPTASSSYSVAAHLRSAVTWKDSAPPRLRRSTGSVPGWRPPAQNRLHTKQETRRPRSRRQPRRCADGWQFGYPAVRLEGSRAIR